MSKIVKTATATSARDPITTALVLKELNDGTKVLVQTFSNGSQDLATNALVSSILERRKIAAYKFNKGEVTIAKGNEVEGVIGVRPALLTFVKDVHKANGTLALNTELMRSKNLALYGIERRNMHLTVVNLNEEDDLKQMKYYMGFAVVNPAHPRLKGGYVDRTDLEYAAEGYFWKRFM